MFNFINQCNYKLLTKKNRRLHYIPGSKLYYLPVPKNGSSTIKRLIYYLNHGFITKNSNQNFFQGNNIHKLYKNTYLLKDLSKTKYLMLFKLTFLNYRVIIVLRDPISRFLSAYNHQVLIKKKLIIQNNISKLDNFDNFVKNFESHFLQNKAIAWHFATQSYHISKNIFKIKNPIYINLDDLNNKLPQFLNYDSSLKTDLFLKQKNNHIHSTKEFNGITKKDLSQRHVDFIRRNYKDDFELFKMTL